MEEELETKLLVDVARLDPEGETLEGEVDIIDLDEPFVKPFGGVRYRLTATSHLSVSDDPGLQSLRRDVRHDDQGR